MLGLGSAALTLAVGAWTATLRPRDRRVLALSALCTLWGVSVASGNLAELLGTAWVWPMLAFSTPLYVPLALVALDTSRWPRARLAAVTALLAAPAVAAVGLMVAAPHLFVEGEATWFDQTAAIVPGPLFHVVATGNSVAAFGLLGLAAAVRAWRPRPHRADAAGLVAAALAAYVSFRAGQVVTGELLLGGRGFAFASGLLAAAAALALLGVALARRDLPWRALVAALAVVPAVFGAVEMLLAVRAGIGGVSTVGVWRAVAVLLLVYALARHRLFDVDARLGRTTPIVAFAVAAGALVLAVWAWAGDLLADRPWAGLAATAGAVLLCAPLPRLSRRVVDHLAPHLGDDGYARRRKVQVYRAALADAMDRGTLDAAQERVFLADLRRALDITEREHDLLALLLEDAPDRSKTASPASPPSGSGTRYEIVRELGRGSQGVAFLARDRVLGRDVVLKQPLAKWLADARARAAFVQEARLAASVHHAHVVTIHDILADSEPPAIVMEYVEGGTLAEALAARGRIPPDEALDITLAVLDALDEVHARGLVHRDLKPANVMLTPTGVAKVTDFGIAAPPPDVGRLEGATTPGSQPGSLAYMSPEQALGDDVDARSDLYAAGAMLYEMLTGRHYLGLGRAGPSTLQRRIPVEPPRLPAPFVPDALVAPLRRALAKPPGERYQAAREMAADLRAALGRATVEVRVDDETATRWVEEVE